MYYQVVRDLPDGATLSNKMSKLARYRRKGPPKFLTEFYKSGSPSNMWQSLMTIGQATSEIRRRKKDLNYSGKTEWPPASITYSWRAAIIKVAPLYGSRCTGVLCRYFCEVVHIFALKLHSCESSSGCACLNTIPLIFIANWCYCHN